ncbi:unnamed protein product, partial [Chrysoparadoxa australica]
MHVVTDCLRYLSFLLVLFSGSSFLSPPPGHVVAPSSPLGLDAFPRRSTDQGERLLSLVKSLPTTTGGDRRALEEELEASMEESIKASLGNVKFGPKE